MSNPRPPIVTIEESGCDSQKVCMASRRVLDSLDVKIIREILGVDVSPSFSSPDPLRKSFRAIARNPSRR